MQKGLLRATEQVDVIALLRCDIHELIYGNYEPNIRNR
jgi:hypothetical protein